MLQGGEEIRASIVASNLDPHRTFLQLMDARDLPAEFVDGIRKFRSEGTSLKMNLALSGVPEFTAFAGKSRTAASRDDAHLPLGRIHRARLG